jgi:single-strand DNA-binding protein
MACTCALRHHNERLTLMADKNLVVVRGRLGADPEVKYTAAGVANCSLSLATGESWKDKDGNKQEATQWHRIVVWRQPAEFIGQYARKGSHIEVEGKLTYRTYENNEGATVYITEIQARQVDLLDPRSDSNLPPAGQRDQVAYVQPGGDNADDDLPF